MSLIKILNNLDIKAFDSPPVFTGEERKQFFYLSKWASELVKSFRTPTNQVGFVLQLGYFKRANRFFVAHKYHKNDVNYLASNYNFNTGDIDFSIYKERTLMRHQELILENIGIKKFGKRTRNLLQNEAEILSSRQTKPRLMFMALVDFLREQKVEIPNYNTFAEIITDTLRSFEKSLVASIDRNLSFNEKQLLKSLLDFGDDYQKDGDKQDSKIKRYKITLLKKSNQSTKPSKIKENIKDLKKLRGLVHGD